MVKNQTEEMCAAFKTRPATLLQHKPEDGIQQRQWRRRLVRYCVLRRVQTGCNFAVDLIPAKKGHVLMAHERRHSLYSELLVSVILDS